MKLFKNICFAVAMFILFFYSWLFQLIPILIFNMNVEKISDAMNVVLSGFASLCLAITLVIIYRKDLIEEWKKFKKNFKKFFDIGLNHWFYGLMVMVISNTLLGILFKAGKANNEEAVQSMISSLPWLMLINAGILAPLNEEIIFRKAFKNVFKNKWVFVLSSGFVFGLMHVLGNVSNWVDVLYIIPYGALGSAFAMSYYKTDTVFTPIAFHMFHNIVLVLVSIF